MNSEKKFETFLYLSNEKFVIIVKEDLKKEYFFKKEFTLDNNKDDIDFDLLNEFLNENIFKIEKVLKKFIQNINLILRHKRFLNIDISIKKDNFGKKINKKILNYSLADANRQIKENYSDYEIIHLLIDKYFINGCTYYNFPIDISSDYLVIDLKFICLSSNIIKNLEKIFKNYQIKISKIISVKYLEDYFKDNKSDIFSNCQKILDGTNQNEVQLISKNRKKMGFFERFFLLFS